MQSVVSRPQPLAPAPTKRVARSTSFMSLRREKSASSPTSDAPRTGYFDAYPQTPSARPAKSKSRDPLTSSPSRNSPKETQRPPVAFPTVDHPPETAPSIREVSKPPERSRSYSGLSGRMQNRYTWTREYGAVPDLRFSGSSTQHTETPPETPVDSFDGGSIRDFPVVVAAPVFGVEMMDALVDGMNGDDEDIGARGAASSARHRFGIPGHHPLYEPPLPIPPPGVVLGGPKHRQQRRDSYSSNSESEGERRRRPPTATRPRKKRPRPPARVDSSATITAEEATPFPSIESTPRKAEFAEPRAVAPSISEIIRTHAPQCQLRSRPSLSGRSSVYTQSHAHSTLVEESEPEPVVLDESDIISRSSVDSIADEIQHTLRIQSALKPVQTLPPPSSFPTRYSALSDNASVASPRSDGAASASLYAPSIMSNTQPTSPIDLTFLSLTSPSPSQAVAQYLRSARLTTLLKLIRSPHASQDNPLTVSLSDLGSPTGFPVVVFLGLGCVRHVMGLYDDMAQCLGLRLITIDRWGLGRTEGRSKTSKGIMQWASVVEEVLDMLHINECSVMAHSAGTPYALSFANKLAERIRGDICLLAPWVGGSENSGYKWLKYVPNGILKTAQAAEWKVQTWMIGKPPTIAYEGIGYTAAPKPRLPTSQSNKNLGVYALNNDEARPRPSIGSGFSEYDDLRDFDGRFESRSTLGAANATRPRANTSSKVTTRKPSRGFLGRLKGSQPPSPTEDPKPAPTGKKIKALRSMGSLKSKSSTYSASSKRSEPSSPRIPSPPKFDVGLGFDDTTWPKGGTSETSLIPERSAEKFYTTPFRADGRRSMSFTSPSTWSPQSPSSSVHSSRNTSSTSVFSPSVKPSSEYQSTLGNALIAASHAESAKGMHNDLLQILNHDNHPWGFSYTRYPHSVNVWYGDKDEKIAENAVRWMQKSMGEDRCTVKVVKGADHALMYKSAVVVEVLEQILGYWQPE